MSATPHVQYLRELLAAGHTLVAVRVGRGSHIHLAIVRRELPDGGRPWPPYPFCGARVNSPRTHTTVVGDATMATCTRCTAILSHLHKEEQ